MPYTDVVTASTDAGLLAVWPAATFADVVDYDAWESRVNERLPDLIAAGDLVPVNIRADGAYGVRVAIAPDGLSDRESTYAVVTSEPYLLVSPGGRVCLSGLEIVGRPEAAPLTVALPAGRYAVRTTLVGWDDEPGATAPNGSPLPTALADFVVQIEPSTGIETFRTAEETFDPPN